MMRDRQTDRQTDWERRHWKVLRVNYESGESWRKGRDLVRRNSLTMKLFETKKRQCRRLRKEKLSEKDDIKMLKQKIRVRQNIDWLRERER